MVIFSVSLMEMNGPSVFPAQSRQCPEDSMLALYSDREDAVEEHILAR